MIAATRFGKPLPAGGTIGVAAAASPYDSLDFDLIVLYGLPLGHTKHLAALPLGVTCTLDADAKTLTVDEPSVR